MKFTGRILNIITAILFFLTGGTTIGISIWLWESNSGDNFSNWNSVCEDYPGRYLRRKNHIHPSHSLFDSLKPLQHLVLILVDQMILPIVDIPMRTLLFVSQWRGLV